MKHYIMRVKDSHPFKKFLTIIEVCGLLIVAIATVIAIGQGVYVIYKQGKVQLGDLLLLFIYLEVITMVGIYYEKNMLPVRFPVYIAIVALARHIILGSNEVHSWEMLGVGVTLLVLALAVFLIRLGHVKFPYDEEYHKKQQEE